MLSFIIGHRLLAGWKVRIVSGVAFQARGHKFFTIRKTLSGKTYFFFLPLSNQFKIYNCRPFPRTHRARVTVTEGRERGNLDRAKNQSDYRIRCRPTWKTNRPLFRFCHCAVIYFTCTFYYRIFPAYSAKYDLP